MTLEYYAKKGIHIRSVYINIYAPDFKYLSYNNTYIMDNHKTYKKLILTVNKYNENKL